MLGWYHTISHVRQIAGSLPGVAHRADIMAPSSVFKKAWKLLGSAGDQAARVRSLYSCIPAAAPGMAAGLGTHPPTSALTYLPGPAGVQVSDPDRI